jgi:hypothetical protein
VAVSLILKRWRSMARIYVGASMCGSMSRGRQIFSEMRCTAAYGRFAQSKVRGTDMIYRIMCERRVFSKTVSRRLHATTTLTFADATLCA